MFYVTNMFIGAFHDVLMLTITSSRLVWQFDWAWGLKMCASKKVFLILSAGGGSCNCKMFSCDRL